MSLASRVDALAAAVRAKFNALSTRIDGKADVGAAVANTQLPTRLRESIGSNAHNSADFALTTGWWYIDGSGVGEKPPGGNDYFVEVIRHADDGLYMTQIAYGFNENRQYMRRRSGSTTWTSWIEVVLDTDARLSDARTPSNDADIVHKAGSENITGAKTFSAVTQFNTFAQVRNDSATGITLELFNDLGPVKLLMHNGSEFYTLLKVDVNGLNIRNGDDGSYTGLRAGAVYDTDNRVFSYANRPPFSALDGSIADGQLPARLRGGSEGGRTGDFNNLVTNGWHMVDPPNTNGPPSGSGYFHCFVENIEGAWITQTAHQINAEHGIVYRRHYVSGTTWNAWYKCRLSEAELDARYVNHTDSAIGDLGGFFSAPLVQLQNVRDTRAVNDLPRAPGGYGGNPARVAWSFKQSSVVGITDGSTFCTVQHVNGYQDASAGRPVQFALTDLGNYYRRVALTAALDSGWGPWTRIDANLDTTAASLRSQANLTNAGTVSVSSNWDVKWGDRFIVIVNGNGSHFSTSGYFDIYMPVSGTVVTGAGGAADKTVNADGISLGLWEAVYYILPIGGGSGTVNANFRVVSYGAGLVIPETWVLLAIRNGDNPNYVKFGHGPSLIAGQSSTPANPYPQYTLGTDARLSDARTPTAHTHAVANLVTTGSKSSATFLRGDDVWASPPIQTYATQTQAQAESSTDVDSRLTTGQRLFQAISKWSVTLANAQTVTGFKTFSVGLSGMKNNASTDAFAGNGLETRNDIGYPSVTFHKSNAYAPQIRAISDGRFQAVNQPGNALIEFEGLLYDNGNRVYSASNPPPADDTGWITPTLLNGWVAYGIGFQAPRYRKIKGVVYVQGLVTGGTLNSDVFELPAGYRPSAILLASVGSDVAGGRLDVLNSVQQQGGGTGFLSLAIPPFPADQ